MAEKRSLQAIYLNTGTTGTPDFALVGTGVADLSIDYGPKTTTEQDISSDTASTELTGYEPKAAVKQNAKKGDDVYDYVNNLRVTRAILDASVTEIVMVDLYQTAVSGAYPAERQSVTVMIDKYGGKGGDPLSIDYTLAFRGDSTAGTFNPTTKTFTAS